MASSSKQSAQSKWLTEYEKKAYSPTNISNLINQSKKDTNAQIDALTAAQKKALDTEYNNLAQQAYVRRMQEQRNVAANVARAGQTGGLAQSTAMVPGITYGNTLAQLGAQRLKGYGDIDLSAGQQKLNAYQNYANQSITQANNDRTYNYTAYRDLLNDDRYQTELLYNQAQLAAQYGDYSKLKALGINPKVVTQSSSGGGSSRSRSRGSSSSSSSSKSSLSTGLSPDQYARYNTSTKQVYVGGYGWMTDGQLARLLKETDSSGNPTIRASINNQGKYNFYKSTGPSYYGG